jgi:hypothetical protein
MLLRRFGTTGAPAWRRRSHDHPLTGQKRTDSTAVCLGALCRRLRLVARVQPVDNGRPASANPGIL